MARARRAANVDPMSAPTPHLSALPGEIAETVLLPGDPLRAEWIATTYLDGVRCHNRVRGMLGFTGTFEGRRVSVQGTGMGMPSMSIYATELLRFYGVTTAIRVGSCGAMSEAVALRDVIVATAAHTDSAMLRPRFGEVAFAPTASFELLSHAARAAAELGQQVHLGTVFTSDAFYDSDAAAFDVLRAHGTLAVEMETAALYAIAAKEGARALALFTVSDHLLTHEAISSDDRQLGFASMVELALATATAAAPTSPPISPS